MDRAIQAFENAGWAVSNISQIRKTFFVSVLNHGLKMVKYYSNADGSYRIGADEDPSGFIVTENTSTGELRRALTLDIIAAHKDTASWRGEKRTGGWGGKGSDRQFQNF